jgi:hypothetical protein
LNTTQPVALQISGLLPGTTNHFQAVAVNSAGTNYGGDLVLVTPALPPLATTLAASAISATNATLNALINPNGGAATVYFNWGATTNYGSVTASNVLSANLNTAQAVALGVAGLLPGTTNHFQAVAANSAGTNYGGDLVVVTLPLPPLATTLAASAISATNATLNATVIPNGASTAVYFQWGATTNYGNLTASNTLSANLNTAQAVSALIGSLLPGTTNHFRVVASNSSGTSDGLDLTIVTPPTGSLEVTITPANAVSAGAEWQVDGGAWKTSGAVVSGLLVGTNHTLAFNVIDGWSTPSNQTVTITRGATTTNTGVYTPQKIMDVTLTITSPKPSQSLSLTNADFTVIGTAVETLPAKNHVVVESVYYQLNESNGGSWTLATPSNSWSNWTASVILRPGTNTISAYAVDTSSNASSITKVTFNYIRSATLVVHTNGNGTFTPKDNGALLAIGTNYTLTASPAKNWLFFNWVGGTTLPYRVLSISSNYTFAMQSNLVLEANFVTNPFLAVAGVYSGLFYPTNGVTEASSGFISATIASNSTGAYTAKLLLDGGSNSFSGSFDLTGTAQTNLTRSGKTPVSVTLSLDFNPADALLGGSVSNAAAGWNSVILADRAVFNTTANPATNYAGQFTLLLPPGANAPVESPDGYGYAAITNTLGGISTLGGALADGTPFLWSVPIARNGGIPFYQSLYSGKGSLLGWIYFTNEPPQNVSTNSSVSWIKPVRTGGLYPLGFTNLSLSGVLGSPFTNTARAGVPVLNLTSATLVLRNGNLTNGFLIYTNIGTNLGSHNTLTNLNAGNRHLSPTNYLVIAVNTNNGVVTVTFQPTGAKTNTIAHGAVLQNQTNAAGYFLGTNESGAFILGTP